VLNAAMKAIAGTNPKLSGALPQGYAALPLARMLGLAHATLSPRIRRASSLQVHRPRSRT